MSQKLAKLIFEKAAQSKAMPQTIHPIFAGKHLPVEHLMYATDKEAQILRSQTDGKSDTTQWGPQSFTDPSQSYGHTLSSSFSNSGPTGGLGSNYSSGSGYSANNWGGGGSSWGSSVGGSGPGVGLGSNQSNTSSYHTSSPSSSSSNTGGGGGSAMQGGFGAQSFGNSTTSAAAIHNAVNAGFSAGYNSAAGGGGSNATFRDLNGIANTLGQRMQGGGGQVAFGGAPIGSYTVRQQTQPQPVASFASPQITPQRHNDFVSIDSVGNIPYSGPHPRPVTVPTVDSAVASTTNSGPHARPQLETAFADPVNSFAGIENPDPRFVDPRKGYYDQNGVTPQTQFANRLREETQLHGMNPNDKAIAAQMGSLMNENLHAYMTPASNPWDIGSAASFGNFKNIGTNPDGKVTAGGSAQWNSGRLNQVNDFFKQNGINPNDPNSQAAAVAAETAGHLPGQRGNYKDTYNALSGMSLPNATQSWMRNYENPSYNPAVNRIADRQDSAQQFAGNFPSSNYQDTQMADWNMPPQIQIASTNDAPIDQTARNPFPFKAGSPEYVAARQQADATNNASVPVQVANFVQQHAPGIGGLLDDGGGIYGNSGNSGNSDGGVRLAGFSNNSGDNGSRAAIINSAIDAALNHNKTPPAVTPPVASQGPIGPAYSIATAQGNYIVDSHGQYFMLDRTGAYMPVAPPRGAVA